MIVVMGWKKSTIEESLSKYVSEKKWYHEGRIKISCGGKTGIFDRDEK